MHDTAPDIAGKNIANPTALLLSGISMLQHLGLMQSAASIENALLYTLEHGLRTSDFGDKSKPTLKTRDFANAIITNFGKISNHNAKQIMADQPASRIKCRLDKNLMMKSNESISEKIVGIGIFNFFRPYLLNGYNFK